jgi:hypothetical protein
VAFAAEPREAIAVTPPVMPPTDTGVPTLLTHPPMPTVTWPHAVSHAEHVVLSRIPPCPESPRSAHLTCVRSRGRDDRGRAECHGRTSERRGHLFIYPVAGMRDQRASVSPPGEARPSAAQVACLLGGAPVLKCVAAIEGTRAHSIPTMPSVRLRRQRSRCRHCGLAPEVQTRNALDLPSPYR